MARCRLCGREIYRAAADLRRNVTGTFVCSKACQAKHSRAKNPKQYARYAVGYAVKIGRLVKAPACERCGSSAVLEAHHPDHRRPLRVVWLCRPCHDAVSRPARLAEVERRRKHFDPCLCGRPAVTRGMCATCYSRWRDARLGTPCRVPGCTNPSHTRGLCSTHRRKPDVFSAFALPPAKRGPVPKPRPV